MAPHSERLRRVFEQSRLALLVVPAIAVLCYWNSLDGGFVWDDQKLILEDPAIKSPEKLAQVFTSDFFFRRESDFSYGYYRPFTTLSYAADYALCGLSARGFHVTNIALHAACALLVVSLMSTLGAGRAASLLCGSIFAAHPIHTENVAWISGRTDVLAFLLGGAALWFHLEGFAPRADGVRRGRVGFLAISIGLFAAALLAKEMAVVVALWMALVHLLSWKSGPLRTARALAPYAVVALGYAIVRFSIVDVPVPAQPAEHSFAAAALGAPFTILRYLAWMVLPLGQSAYVQNPYMTGPADPRFFLSLAVVGLLVAISWRALRGRGKGPIALFGALLAVSFLPILNFVRLAAPLDMGDVMAERFCYFPSFPLFGLISVWAVGIAKGRAHPRARIAFVAAAILTVGCAGAATVCRNAVWRDEPTLFEDALTASPGATLLLGNLANHHIERGELDAAEQVLERAAKEDRRDYSYLTAKALLLVARGEYPEALALQEEIVRHSAPSNVASRNNLSFLLRASGRLEEAEALLEPIVAEGRAYGDVYFNLAEIRRAQRRYDEARELYHRAFEELPDKASIGVSLASFELERGRPGVARAVFEQLLTYHRDDPGLLNSLGVAALRDGDERAAIRAFSRMVTVSPGYSKGRLNYARALLARGDSREAIVQLAEIARREPGTAMAREAEALMRSIPTGKR